MDTCSQCNTQLPVNSDFCPRCGTPNPGAEADELLASSASDPTGLLDRLRKATEGEFTVIRELGRGGMGRVMLAHEIALDRRVAMKVLPPALADHAEIVERFQRESRTAGKLSHPHIVAVYKVATRDGLTFFTMPYIAGPNLRQVLRKTPQLPIELAHRYFSEAADALGYAHSRGVIHRDVKPENMLLEGSRDGRLMVTDFGIAKALGVGTTLTRPGDLMGTPFYMSPEQCVEKDRIDGRSDQYSLGLLAYEMLAGRFPLKADSMAAIVYRQLHEFPEPLETVRPDVPERLHSVIWQAIQKDPAKRFPTMADLVEALGRPAARPFVAKPPSAAKKKKVFRARGRWITAAAVAIGLVTSGAFYWQTRSAEADSPDQLAEISLPGGNESEAEPLLDPVDSVAAAGTPLSSGSEAGVETDASNGVQRGGDPPPSNAEDEEQRRLLEQEVGNARQEALAARRGALAAAADSMFTGDFSSIDSVMNRATALFRSGNMISAGLAFGQVIGRYQGLADRARRESERLAAADSQTVAQPGDGSAAGGGDIDGDGPSDREVPIVTPEEAINALLEVYRQALEAEDLEALRRDVYRTEIPDDDAEIYNEVFKAAQDLKVDLEIESLTVSGERARALVAQRMEFRLRNREARGTTFNLEMNFARTDTEWRLEGLKRR